ncbi:hypothetical protein FAES_3765 [Fibrella aestuarina BUZ 2]|uniref:Uncharacterized protein n=1 Tax=Fibrella aestuarina BUZ 2 TaxID=1166018 RepID=I0KCB9_9BACT|nr:hypothetical protein FAES_3765 [Fibrella aestuarina BUZ 2]
MGTFKSGGPVFNGLYRLYALGKRSLDDIPGFVFWLLTIGLIDSKHTKHSYTNHSHTRAVSACSLSHRFLPLPLFAPDDRLIGPICAKK